MYTITYMTKEQRQTKSVTCNWFAISTINQRIDLVYQNLNSITGETLVSDLISWSFPSHGLGYGLFNSGNT